MGEKRMGCGCSRSFSKILLLYCLLLLNPMLSRGAEQGAVLQEGCCLKWRDVLLHWEAAVHYWRRAISDIKSFRCRGRATNNVCGRFI
ncbi:hypothetical protein [Bartonella sp. B1098]|uniref:hypothetical protein n=1 Tax=Bartonella sp. B1098 TaxID=2911421 RepID=UPI0020C297AD|nr:hypothetical protein [Bartonella sp. B1098]